jgi:glyoxylase-like metal-dependent hydrolase (beta-lactamase superfamily II)
MGVVRVAEKGCNIYLVDNFLIDAGIKSLELVKKSVKDVDGLIITHAHYDHIQSAKAIHEEFGCDIYAHEIEIPYILGEKRMRYSGFLGVLATAFEKLLRIEYPDEVKRITEIMDCFDIGFHSDSGLYAIHTPGHTPGSICIKFGDSLICGDLLRGKNSGKAGLSPKLFCSNYEAYLTSVRSVLDVDFKRVYPGHGSPVSRDGVEEVVRRVKAP